MKSMIRSIKIATLGSLIRGSIVIILLVSIILMYFSSIFENDFLKWMGILLFIPCSFLLIWSASRNDSKSMTAYMGVLIFGLLIFSGARGTEVEKVEGVDFSYVGRLMLLAGALIIGLSNFRSVMNIAINRPLVWVTILCLIVMGSSLISPRFLYSLSLAISFCSCVLFSISVAAKSFPRQIYLTLLFIFGFIITLSWVSYFVNSELSSYYTLTWDGFKVWRFKGTTSHPNTMGMLTGLSIGVLLICVQRKWIKSLVSIPLFFMFLATLYASFSRTSWVATFASIIFLYIVYNPKLLKILLPVLIFIVILFSFISLGFLEGLSRSGSLSELQTFTGRLGLWLVALGIISNSLWFGYGFMSTSSVFEVYASGTWEAMHSHNMFIESMIFFGVFGTIWLVILYIDSLIQIINKKKFELAFISLFTFISGITETSLMSRSFVLLIVLTLILSMDPKRDSLKIKE